MEQLAPAARVVPQAFVPVAMGKSLEFVPPMAMLVIFSVALPLLVSVAARGDAVVPAVVLGKASVEVNFAIGTAAAVPVPDSEAVCVAGVALSVTVSVAAYA
jgi:hypothetical protein